MRQLRDARYFDIFHDIDVGVLPVGPWKLAGPYSLEVASRVCLVSSEVAVSLTDSVDRVPLAKRHNVNLQGRSE